MNTGNSTIDFVIGGSLGLSDEELKKKIVMVLPTYNEALNIEKFLKNADLFVLTYYFFTFSFRTPNRIFT